MIEDHTQPGNLYRLSREGGAKMAFLDAVQRMLGFVLTGVHAAERNALSKQVGQPLQAEVAAPLA